MADLDQVPPSGETPEAGVVYTPEDDGDSRVDSLFSSCVSSVQSASTALMGLPAQH